MVNEGTLSRTTEHPMSLSDILGGLAARLESLKSTISTEEATKHALVMPFLQALGFNVFDPTEVVPEFNADVGTKKNEKVDYAIIRNGEPIIFIECKALGATLSAKHESQLFRYYSTTSCRLAVLTNGTTYQFFGDLHKQNIMDDKHFFSFNLEDYDEEDLKNLRLISKEEFDIDRIMESASQLFMQRKVMERLRALFSDLDDDFIRFVAGPITERVMTKKAIDDLRPIVKAAWSQMVNDQINERFQKVMALGGGQASAPTTAPTPVTAVTQEGNEAAEQAGEPGEAEDGGIVTTDEEIMGSLIVKAIVGEVAPIDRVHMRDAKTYCAMLFDDNNRKPLCRFHFGSKVKSLTVFDADKKEARHQIADVNGIYEHAAAIKGSARLYLGEST
jgi:hypothetical protein